jgi:hypothetical protein
MTHKNGYLKAYRTHDYDSYEDAVNSCAVYNISIQGMDYDEEQIADLKEVAINAVNAIGLSGNRLTFVFVQGNDVKIV